jgi:hypothetical protein
MIKEAWVINDEGVKVCTISYTHYKEGKTSVLFYIDDKMMEEELLKNLIAKHGGNQ